MIFKIKCRNGHLNEIDVEELIRKNTVSVVKKIGGEQTDRIPETLVTNCRECGEQIVIRKTQILKYLEE